MSGKLLTRKMEIDQTGWCFSAFTSSRTHVRIAIGRGMPALFTQLGQLGMGVILLPSLNLCPLPSLDASHPSLLSLMSSSPRALNGRKREDGRHQWAADGPFCFWPRAGAQCSMPSHIRPPSLQPKKYCLTPIITVTDSEC